MAIQYYGLNLGANEFTNVTEQASSPGKAVEVAVDLSAGLTREQVLDLLELIEQQIMSENWPPA